MPTGLRLLDISPDELQSKYSDIKSDKTELRLLGKSDIPDVFPGLRLLSSPEDIITKQEPKPEGPKPTAEDLLKLTDLGFKVGYPLYGMLQTGKSLLVAHSRGEPMPSLEDLAFKNRSITEIPGVSEVIGPPMREVFSASAQLLGIPSLISRPLLEKVPNKIFGEIADLASDLTVLTVGSLVKEGLKPAQLFTKAWNRVVENPKFQAAIEKARSAGIADEEINAFTEGLRRKGWEGFSNKGYFEQLNMGLGEEGFARIGKGKGKGEKAPVIEDLKGETGQIKGITEELKPLAEEARKYKIGDNVVFESEGRRGFLVNGILGKDLGNGKIEVITKMGGFKDLVHQVPKEKIYSQNSEPAVQKFLDYKEEQFKDLSKTSKAAGIPYSDAKQKIVNLSLENFYSQSKLSPKEGGGQVEITPISKEDVTPELLDRLGQTDRDIITKRVLEGKSLQQTADEIEALSSEWVASAEKGIADHLKTLKEAATQTDETLISEFEKEANVEKLARRKDLKDYLSGKLKTSLIDKGEYSDLKHLKWLFAKEGERGYTPDELVGELNDMGFQVESDNDVRALISDYFKEDIWNKAAKVASGMERQAAAKMKRSLSHTQRTKIQEELRVGKLRVVADQLTKLAEVAPRLITPKQAAYIHILKNKNYLTDQQYARLKKVFTGKKTLSVTTPTGKLKKSPATKEEATKLTEAMKNVVPRKPIITGQPPVIPRTKALVPSEWNEPLSDLTSFQAAPLSGLDPVRAAELVDGKPYGIVRKFIVEPARDAERQWKQELKTILDGLTTVSRIMRSGSKLSELTFKHIEGTLSPDEEKLITPTIRQTSEYLQKVYDDVLVRINEKRALLDKVPIQKRKDYITHIQELSLLDEFYQGMSNIPNEAANVPSFSKSNMPWFKFALQRLGGKEFEVDAIKAFEVYIRKAMPVIHNTDVLKSARPLVDRLPHNAYKYFNQYLNETMALRPTEADKFVPRSILSAISWLRNKMGKGAILGNLASVFNQVFTLPNSVAAIGPKYISSALLKMHKNEWRTFTEAHSKILQGRIFEIEFDPTLLSKVDKTLGFLIQTFDREMVRLAWGAQFEKMLGQGSTFENAIKSADDIAFKTQSGFNVTDIPPMFRSKIGGAFLQFQNTVNNGLNFLRFDLGKEGKERGKWGVFKAGLMWLGTLLAMNRIYRELGIQSPLNDWTDIFPAMSLAEYGPPVTFSIPTSMLSVAIAKNPQDRTKAMRALRRAAFLFLPAGNQVRKTLEGILAISKGGKFDKKGRLLFPIQP